MTESTVTQSLLAYLKENHPQYTVLKHSDRFTKGIPDLSVSLGLKTVWVEVKVLKKNKTIQNPKDFVDNPVQLELTRRLRGLYYVYDPTNHRTLLATAEQVYYARQRGIYLTDSTIVIGKAHFKTIEKIKELLYEDRPGSSTAISL